jgi:succinate dehydrogenase/fumarate reductase-like Fe-S protein
MIHEYDVVIVGGGTQVCPKRIKVKAAILKTKKKILQELHLKKEQETV